MRILEEENNWSFNSLIMNVWGMSMPTFSYYK